VIVFLTEVNRMVKNVIVVAAIVLAFAGLAAAAYKPIVCMHGFTGSYVEFNQIKEELDRYQPGHPFFALDVDNGKASKKRLQKQVDNAVEVLDNIIAQNQEAFKDGFILVGHSQGGLVARAMFMQHRYNITKFISLASMQGGYYGHCGFWIFKGITCEMASDFFYTKLLQNTFSVASYWRSPKRSKYLKRNLFMPLLNNEEHSPATAEYMQMQKDNFLAVGEFHFFGSPADESIAPWFSQLFDTLDTDGETRVPIQNQYIYTHDTFGLRTAMEQGRVHFYEVPNVKHTEWLSDTEIFYHYLFPLFD